jgi:two-component system, NtrC family, response regulator AtoC
MKDGSIVKNLKEALKRFRDKEGSLFLDEFSDIDPPSQVGLLRLLQDGKIGSSAPHRALIFAATSQPLRRKVEEGSFRSDLLFRFNTFDLPDLVKRPLDALSLLIWKAKLEGLELTLSALKVFLADPFHGNVRTLMAQTIPRLEEVKRSEGKQVVNFAMMAKALQVAGAPSDGLGCDFDDPEKVRVRLVLGKSSATVESLVNAVAKNPPS